MEEFLEFLAGKLDDECYSYESAASCTLGCCPARYADMTKEKWKEFLSGDRERVV